MFKIIRKSTYRKLKNRAKIHGAISNYRRQTIVANELAELILYCQQKGYDAYGTVTSFSDKSPLLLQVSYKNCIIKAKSVKELEIAIENIDKVNNLKKEFREDMVIWSMNNRQS